MSLDKNSLPRIPFHFIQYPLHSWDFVITFYVSYVYESIMMDTVAERTVLTGGAHMDSKLTN